MKLAHRIVTPVFAIGAIAMGLFMKLFYFGLNFDESISELAGGILGLAQLFMGDKDIVEVLRPFLNYEFSAFELITMLVKSPDSGSQAEAFLAIFEPIKAELSVFLAFLIFAVIALIVIAVLSAMGKRKATIITSCVGLAFLMVSIVSSRLAFDAVKAGEISLGALASSIANNDILKTILDLDAAQELVNECIIVQKAILSGGFFAIFGMFLLIIFWTIFANMLIKTPIHIKRKHRRKLVVKRPSAIFHK